jgi:hypothetical protein
MDNERESGNRFYERGDSCSSHDVFNCMRYHFALRRDGAISEFRFVDRRKTGFLFEGREYVFYVRRVDD